MKVYLGCLLIAVSCFACHRYIPTDYTTVKDSVVLKPDYSGITIPCNIAPLNFRVCTQAAAFSARFSTATYTFDVFSGNGKMIIPQRKWQKLLSGSNTYKVEIFTMNQEQQWTRHPEIVNHVVSDSIDPYLVYRLIKPGYELWNEMGIYQRCIANFEEQPLIVNTMTDKNCMNCHSFCKNHSGTMALHMRGNHAGTYILKNKEVKRIQTKTDETISAGVYPSWHPDGTQIAFSTNKTIQFFHAVPDKRIEVFDMESDIVIYDLAGDSLIIPPVLNNREQFETFPHWSPDGEYLYFCSAEARDITRYEEVKYSLLRVKYNAGNHTFSEPDTIYNASETGKSVSFPRISPDGAWLMMTLSDYGNFSIWHRSADLYTLNLKTYAVHKLTANSNHAESYHCWSGTGRWFAFSSRRDDGQYTRPYFAFFDTLGNARKPFVLPQKDPDFYDTFLEAFNVPELVDEKVKWPNRLEAYPN